MRLRRKHHPRRAEIALALFDNDSNERTPACAGVLVVCLRSSALMGGVALAAIDRAIALGNERHGRRFAASGAHRLVLLTGSVGAVCLARGTAILATGSFRLTWSLPPHSPTGRSAPRFRAPLAFSRVNPVGLTSRTRHARRALPGLRGPLCPRLASACNHRPECNAIIIACVSPKFKFIFCIFGTFGLKI